MTNKKIPLRKCVGCQEMKEKKQLVRIVKLTDDEIVIDETGKKNGRGAYICRSILCYEKARKSKAIERSLKMNVSDDVYLELKKEMSRIDR